MNSNIYQWLFEHVSAALDSYIFTTTTDVITWLMPKFASLLAIYFALWGWAFWRGSINDSFRDFLSRVFKLAFIPFFALSIGMYAGSIAGGPIGITDVILELPDEVAGVVANGSASAGAGHTYATVLDDLMDKGFALGEQSWKQAGLSSIAPIFIALLVWVATVAFTAYAAILVLISKVALGILIPLGPIFIMLMLFDATRRFLESWLSQVLNAAFVVILAASATKVMFALYGQYLTTAIATAEASGTPSIGTAVALLALTVVMVAVLLQIPSIASSLAGGIALNTQGQISKAFGHAGAAVQGSTPLAMSRQIRNAQLNANLVRNMMSGGV